MKGVLPRGHVTYRKFKLKAKVDLPVEDGNHWAVGQSKFPTRPKLLARELSGSPDSEVVIP